ncbi:hypothetical protein ACE7GA_07230 [Roseomonas sp. CCTCC AB2023176]|uniref:hypothetical protein n=1 Tax=Roseomonas sp. CCTCC AB2023176 TaxID=3342640 RepID=UPI0035D8084F
MIVRRAFLLTLPAFAAAAQQAELAGTPPGPITPARPGTPEGDALIARARDGGLVLYQRHADTSGEPCDRSFRVGDRAGQRNISPAGRVQAAEIGRRLRDLGIPVALPVPAGPVFRARDTAEVAFGPENVRVTDELLADDYAGGRLDWVLAAHRRLLSDPVPAGTNRVLVGHRTPAIMVLGPAVASRALPEGAFVILEPVAASAPRILGVLDLVPAPGGGWHGCG